MRNAMCMTNERQEIEAGSLGSEEAHERDVCVRNRNMNLCRTNVVAE